MFDYIPLVDKNTTANVCRMCNYTTICREEPYKVIINMNVVFTAYSTATKWQQMIGACCFSPSDHLHHNLNKKLLL